MLVLLARLVTAQGTVEYERRELKIPMRDGVTLFAVALIPKGATAPLPILLVPNIFAAKPEDFRAQTHRVWHTARYPSHLSIAVMP